jgi:hypothetical protein
MKVRTEGQIQKIIDLEIVLILIAIGLDILIEALGGQDWIAAAVIIAGFCMILGLYWHMLHIDNLFDELHGTLHHFFHGTTGASNSHAIPLPTSFERNDGARDVPMAAVADRPIIRVSNFLLSKNFYAQALAPLGYSLTTDFPALGMASFGIGTSSDLWIKGGGIEQKLRASFSATRKNLVDDFFDAALDAGGNAVEMPGSRPDRGAGFYAASVLDPDGYTIEAVFHDLSAHPQVIDDNE